MSDRFVFTHSLSFTTATGQASGAIIRGVTMAAANCNDVLFAHGLFGLSVSASSGSWGAVVQATAPDGTFVTVGGYTSIGATTKVVFPADNSGTTFTGAILRPSRVVWDKVQGGSGSLTATFWGVLGNP